MAKYYSARQFGEAVDLPHAEIIRRIRRGDIKANKLGWNWVLHEDEVTRVKDTEWYRRVLKRRRQRERTAASASA